MTQISNPKKFGLGLGFVLFLVACGGGGGGGGALTGIASLGADFVRAFEQGPKDEPLFKETDPVLTLTPKKEPFDI